MDFCTLATIISETAQATLYQYRTLTGNRIWRIEWYRLRALTTTGSAINTARMQRYLSIC